MIELMVKEYQETQSEGVFANILAEMHNTITYKANNYNLYGYEFDDKYQECTIALMNAVEKYKPTKNAKFKTFCSTVLDNHLKNIANSAFVRHKNDEVEVTDEVVEYFSVDTDTSYEDVELRIDIAMTSLSDVDKDILDKLVFEDLTTTKTAEELNLSKGRVSQRMKKITAVLKNELKFVM